MDGEAGWWTTSGNIGLPPLARVMGVGRQQHHKPMISSTVETPRVRALWSEASVDLYLDSIYVPVETLLCKDYNCVNSYHYDELR